MLVPFLTDSSQIRGTVQLAHGFGEHHRRYKPFIHDLNSAGYDVYTFDFTGHGTSPGKPGRVDVAKLIFEHLDARAELRLQARSDRFFLFGHSMGGLITLASTLLDPTDLIATAVTGPALAPQPALPNWLAKLARAAARVAPGVGTVGLDRSVLSHDPRVEAELAEDPYSFEGKVPLLTAASMVEQGKRVLDNAAMLTVPVLILHGDDDRLAAIEGSAEFVARAPGNAEMIVVADSFHEVLNELDRDKSAAEIVQWYNRW